MARNLNHSLFETKSVRAQVTKAYYKSLYGFKIELKISLFPLKSFNKASNLAQRPIFVLIVLEKAICAIFASTRLFFFCIANVIRRTGCGLTDTKLMLPVS